MSELPLEAAAAMTGDDATEAFTLLGNETRLAILVALWEAGKPFAGESPDPTAETAVPYADLRERVGLRHGEQFAYHLEKLVGRFVRKTGAGYELLPAGTTLVHALIASAGFAERSLPPTELDVPCLLCGAPTAITYQHQRLYHICTECEGHFALGEPHPTGVLGGWIANPAILNRRTPEAIYTAIYTEMFHAFAMRAAGVCPKCSGSVATSLHVCDAHDPETNAACPACGRHYQSAAQFVCTDCKNTGMAAVPSVSLRHPAVIAFYWNAGIALGYNSQDTARLFLNLTENADTELVSAEPPRVRVSFCHEGDAINLTYDEAMNVVDVAGGE